MTHKGWRVVKPQHKQIIKVNCNQDMQVWFWVSGFHVQTYSLQVSEIYISNQLGTFEKQLKYTFVLTVHA